MLEGVKQEEDAPQHAAPEHKVDCIVLEDRAKQEERALYHVAPEHKVDHISCSRLQ